MAAAIWLISMGSVGIMAECAQAQPIGAQVPICNEDSEGSPRMRGPRRTQGIELRRFVSLLTERKTVKDGNKDSRGQRFSLVVRHFGGQVGRQFNLKVRKRSGGCLYRRASGIARKDNW